MKKLLFIILLIPLLIGCTRADNLGASDTVTEKKVIETVTKIGYYHYFKDGDEVQRIEITKEEYEALGAKGAGQPQRDGLKWLGSSGGVPTITTSVPEILDNEFFTLSTTTDEYLLKEVGESVKKVNKDYLLQKYETINSDIINNASSSK